MTVERDDTEPTTIGTAVSVRIDDRTGGIITLVDRQRPDAPAAVQAVADLVGAPIVLLTGDNPASAASVAGHTGIETIHAGLLPEDKVRVVNNLQARGERVLLVGDGINDAPALAAAAAAGIAMGRHGSDLALDTADAVIVRDDLTAIVGLIRISRRARRYLIANLTIAGLIIWGFVGTLPLPLAVAGHEGATIIVALNGIRLLRRHAWEH